MNFTNRSYQEELLDGNDISFDDIYLNMKELNVINTYLGGHQITISGFKKLIGHEKEITLCEVGCGGGDNLAVVYRYCKRRHIKASLIGIDINPYCIQIAKSRLANRPARYYEMDYRQVFFSESKPTILFSSLFCHHFTEKELVAMLQWMQTNASTGFFINDLQRHPIAYYAIKFLTSLFSKSRLVKHDAPLSVLRGLTKSEWKAILKQAGISNYSIEWKWAFRWLILVKCE